MFSSHETMFGPNNTMELENLVILFKEKCKATYKMPKNETNPIFYVLDNLDKVCLSCSDEELKLNCKQAYNLLLEHDELKASFLEIVKMKNKMSDFMAVVSDGKGEILCGLLL